MRRFPSFVLIALLAACGGKAVARSGTDGGRSGTGGAGSGGQSGSAAMPSYVPTNPNVPPEGDGTLVGGSIEGLPGDGWDTCNSTHPSLSFPSDPPAPSHGERSLLFDSTLPCDSRCSESSGDLQLTFTLDEPIGAGETKHLYFDIATLSAEPPSGTLVIGAVQEATSPTDFCTADQHLADLPLGNLAATSAWQTRCVTFTAEASFQVFGLYVADGTFKIGLDAFRFGPPCR
jgi:hypothetical protein